MIPFEHSFFVLGPTFSTDVSEQYFRKQMEIREMSVSSRIKFLKLMKAIPVVPLTTFGQLARMFYYACYDRNIYFSSFQKLRPSDFSMLKSLFRPRIFPAATALMCWNSAFFPM